jgi:phage-related protein (TIGR01555 family)
MAPRKKKNEIPQEIKNESDNMIRNGLSEAIMGFNPGSIGVQLSQADTMFKNNRWYLISNMRQLLSEMYVEHGLVQTIIDVPVDDGLRGGIVIKSKQLADEEIEKLSVHIEREDDLNTVGQALKWNRLYGGAGVLIITGQDPETPLDMNDLEGLEFRAVDMWELFYDKQNVEGFNPAIQEHGFEFYSYYGVKTHKSRVMKMKGLTAPSFIRPRLRGWGFSVVEAIVRSMNQYLKANDLIFEVLDEFKLDIFKIKNLTNTLLSPQGASKIRERVQLANFQKNYQNAITMDSEDDFATKELSFSGIAETMEGIRKQLASDLRMPLSKLFGISSAGFSSGEDDIENYNAMVESQVRAKSKFDILRVVELRCMELFGYIPDDLKIEFKPLRMLSSEQEENVKTQKFARVLQARQAGEISSKDFLDACNRESLLPIQIDSSGASIDASEGIEGANKDDKFGDTIKKPKKPATAAPMAKEG